MSDFYNSKKYPLSHQLNGEEISYLYQLELTRTFKLNTFVSDLCLDGLINNINDVSDVSIINPQNDNVIVINSGVWSNTNTRMLYLKLVSDITFNNDYNDKQYLVANNYNWFNNHDLMVLCNYCECEYDNGVIGDDITIDLMRGNIQKITIVDDITITLPSIPIDNTQNKIWSLTLKVKTNDGLFTPNFIVPDGVVKWTKEIIPDILKSDRTYIYVFISDSIDMCVYAFLTWIESDPEVLWYDVTPEFTSSYNEYDEQSGWLFVNTTPPES